MTVRPQRKVLTLSKEADVNQASLYEYFGQDEAERGDEVNERRGWTAVMPSVPHEAVRRGTEERRRIAGAGAHLEAQLVPVVGEIPDFEGEGDGVKGQKDDAGADETHEEVELEVRLLAVGPRKSDVQKETRDRPINEKPVKCEHE